MNTLHFSRHFTQLRDGLDALRPAVLEIHLENLITPDFRAGSGVETRGDCAIPSRKRCRICGGYTRATTLVSLIWVNTSQGLLMLHPSRNAMNRLLTQAAHRPASFVRAAPAATCRRRLTTSISRPLASIQPQPATPATPHRAPPTAVQSLGKTKAGRDLRIRSYPRFATPEEERRYRKEHLAAAFRVFADRGYDEGVAGHISVRDPILTDHFWLNPLSAHFSQIRVSDLILVDEDGAIVEGDEPINTAAFTIHSAIHRGRPDVHAACHAHSVHGKAFSAFGRELEMITQDSLRFYGSHAVYRHFGGVVVDADEGQRIAGALGNGKAVILQNHGLLTVGQSVDEAAFWFMSLDRTCQAQLLADAAAAGGYEKVLIDEDECKFSAQSVGAPEKGWLAFQPYYDEVLAKTKGDFLK